MNPGEAITTAIGELKYRLIDRDYLCGIYQCERQSE